MKRSSPSESKERPRELIGEMMLAKSVMEEKSELLEQKEEVIRQLRHRQRQLDAELGETRRELELCTRELESSRERARREGIRYVVEQVVCLAADYEVPDTGAGTGLAVRLIGLFQEKYGLEVVESAAEGVDPQIHQVIVAEHDPQGRTSIQVLRKGFRLAGKVIRPALVKVVEGNPEVGHRQPKRDGHTAGRNAGL